MECQINGWREEGGRDAGMNGGRDEAGMDDKGRSGGMERGMEGWREGEDGREIFRYLMRGPGSGKETFHKLLGLCNSLSGKPMGQLSAGCLTVGHTASKSTYLVKNLKT